MTLRLSHPFLDLLEPVDNDINLRACREESGGNAAMNRSPSRKTPIPPEPMSESKVLNRPGFSGDSIS